ncbi:hypothetical protein LQW54_004421 [Pestalotiopsis sp. IQ-011]
MSKQWSARPNEPADDDLDDLVFRFWDDDDPRFQAAPQILVDSLEYGIDNDGNAYDSSLATYPNGHLGLANYTLEGLQSLNLDPTLPGYPTPYDWTAAGIPARDYVTYDGCLAPSPQQAPRAIPATYQPDFEDCRSSYHGYSAPPTLARGVISASSHHPGTPQRPSTVLSHEDSKRYSCSECGKDFKQRKDLERHKPKHDPKIPDGQIVKGRYFCRCGKGTHRKDNHRRHLTTCVLKRYKYHRFVCQCLFETGNKKEHEDHIGKCREGIKPVGRPSRSRATSTIASLED